MSRHLAVLGGGRMIGPPLLRAAVDQGWRVTVLNRQSPPPADLAGVAHLAGDRGDPAVVAELASLAPDAVVDLSCYEPEHLDLSLRALLPRTTRYVMMSTAAVYAPGDLLPWDEAQPLGGDPLWGAYGDKKLRNEQLAAELAGGSPDVPIVALRAPYLVGQPDFMRRLQFIADRVAHDGLVFVSGTGRALIQLLSPVDVASALLHLARPDLGLDPGRVTAFNLGSDRYTSLSGLVRLLAAAMDRPEPEIVPVELATVGLAEAPFSWTDMVFPFADSHFLVDDAKLRATGFEPAYGLTRLLREFVTRYGDAGGPSLPERSPAERAARSSRSTHTGA
jgi:nucleoside-diphosphate-sugar epimerase